MTTTALHPTTCLVTDHTQGTQSFAARAWQTLATLATRAVDQVQTQQTGWRETQALSAMDEHLLRDIGAPDWLHQRAQSRKAQDCREHFQALSRFRY